MSQKKIRKSRKCQHCKYYFETTAAEIKAHAEECKHNQRKVVTGV